MCNIYIRVCEITYLDHASFQWQMGRKSTIDISEDVSSYSDSVKVWKEKVAIETSPDSSPHPAQPCLNWYFSGTDFQISMCMICSNLLANNRKVCLVVMLLSLNVWYLYILFMKACNLSRPKGFVTEISKSWYYFTMRDTLRTDIIYYEGYLEDRHLQALQLRTDTNTSKPWNQGQTKVVADLAIEERHI